MINLKASQKQIRAHEVSNLYIFIFISNCKCFVSFDCIFSYQAHHLH